MLCTEYLIPVAGPGKILKEDLMQKTSDRWPLHRRCLPSEELAWLECEFCCQLLENREQCASQLPFGRKM